MKKIPEKTIREKLLIAGMRNLREFGYPSANTTNILTVHVFKMFFKSMLEENKGKGGPEYDTEIDKLLKEIETTTP